MRFGLRRKHWKDERGMMMRLDKFLKVSRIIKRRTVAKEVCDKGRVKINGQVAKAGSVVKVGDELTIQFGNKIITFKIERLEESIKKEEALSMYTITNEERLDQTDN